MAIAVKSRVVDCPTHVHPTTGEIAGRREAAAEDGIDPEAVRVVGCLGRPRSPGQPEVVQGLDRTQSERRPAGVAGAELEGRFDVVELLVEGVERGNLVVAAQTFGLLDGPLQDPVTVTITASIEVAHL